jgi:NADPH2:quinone reductase
MQSRCRLATDGEAANVLGVSGQARAVRLFQVGVAPRVEDVELPEPEADEQLVTLAYAGVNPADRYTAAGLVAPDGPLPRTIGLEASGWTADGQLVVVTGSGLGMFRDGTFASHIVAPNSAIVPVPAGVEPNVAGAIGVSALTAYSVTKLLEPAAGDRVLVLGAGGGVGLSLVSYLAALGAHVCGQVGASGKADAVRAAGARDVVVADASSLADRLASDAGGFVPDSVIDPLGGDFVRAAVDLLAPDGRMVVYGTSAGPEVGLNWQTMHRKGLQISGFGGLAMTPDRRRVALEGAVQAVARGEMRIPIQRTYPLDQFNEAFDALANRSVTGKLLLDLQA